MRVAAQTRSRPCSHTTGSEKMGLNFLLHTCPREPWVTWLQLFYLFNRADLLLCLTIKSDNIILPEKVISRALIPFKIQVGLLMRNSKYPQDMVINPDMFSLLNTSNHYYFLTVASPRKVPLLAPLLLL